MKSIIRIFCSLIILIIPYYAEAQVNRESDADLGVRFRDIKVKHKNNAIQVDWEVDNEVSIVEYYVERSIDGSDFVQIKTVAAQNNGLGVRNYFIEDKEASKACDNFYRIKASNTSGNTEYSMIDKILALPGTEPFSIYPNPVVSRLVKLKVSASVKGKYSVYLLNIHGKSQLISIFDLPEGQSTQNLNIPHLTPAGIYRIKIVSPEHKIHVVTLTLI